MTRVCVAPAVCIGLAIGVVVGAPADERLPRDNLMLYRGDDGKPREVRSVADWAKRRAEIVRGAESVMGKLPGKEKRCALEPKVEEEEVDCGKYVRRLHTTRRGEQRTRSPAARTTGTTSGRCPRAARG